MLANGESGLESPRRNVLTGPSFGDEGAADEDDEDDDDDDEEDEGERGEEAAESSLRAEADMGGILLLEGLEENKGR